jgi:hypothetical protein
MNRKFYIELMILPVYLSNYTSVFANSNVSVFQYMLPMIISQNSVVIDVNFQVGMKNILARDDQTEDCLRLGICKD